MPTPQNLRNHSRYDPIFHFVLIPILIINIVYAISATIHHWPQHRALFLWWVVMSFVFLVVAGKSRGYALKVQDRVIRLEERLRMASILPPGDLAHIDELDIKQLIALRFASDGELSALVRKTLTQGLEPKAIKQNIVNWRADDNRV